MDRTCRDCNRSGDSSFFCKDNRRKDKLTVYCRECCRKRNKETYRRHKTKHLERTKRYIADRNEVNRLFLWDYKLAHPCADCGEKDPRVLQFDHVRGKKVGDITYLAYCNHWPPERLKTEIAKCDVRCANCHLKRTWDSARYAVPKKHRKVGGWWLTRSCSSLRCPDRPFGLRTP